MRICNDLRQAVLQAAIEGKLTKQLPEDGDAKDLLKQIKNEKERLIKGKKIIHKKPTDPFFESEDLEVLNIPNNWTFAQLSEVSLIQEGAGIRKWQYREEGTQLLCVTNILDGAVDLGKKSLYISTKEYEEKYVHLTLNIGDIVCSCSGGSWGKSAIYDKSDIVMLNTSTLRLRFFGDLADNLYLYYLTKSEWFKKQLRKQLSGMQPNFGYSHYSRIIIPLPPLAEQHRIVAKVEELMTRIDDLEKTETELEKLKAAFPGDMKAALLQAAMQGKLTEQLPEDGDAADLINQIAKEKNRLIKEGKIKKEKPLPEIMSDEMPFDIPGNWQWIKIGNISRLVTKGTTPRGGNVSYSNSGIGFLRAENVAGFDKINKQNLNFVNEETHLTFLNRSILKAGDILITIAGTLGRTALVRKEDLPLNANQAVSLIRMVNEKLIDLKYIIYAINSPLIQKSLTDQKKITAIPNLTLEIITNFIIPLPPLAEQKRIVEKLDKLLPLCDGLVEE